MAHDHAATKRVDLTPKKLADTMKHVEFCMMTTVAANGDLHSRPMSNNKDVEWDGDTWFFTQADSSQAREIQANPNVNLGYSRPDKMVFVSLTGRGEIVHDEERKKELWYKALEIFLPEGPEDPNVVLIRVHADYAFYWSKEGEGELHL